MMKSKIAHQWRAATPCMSFGMLIHLTNKFNFVASFAGKEAELMVRKLPCLCAACRAEQFDDCESVPTVGAFEDRAMEKKGTRRPQMRFEEYSRAVQDGKRTFTVESIIESQYCEGVYQYKVLWEGFDDATWVDADRLNCIDLIEKFEGSRISE